MSICYKKSTIILYFFRYNLTTRKQEYHMRTKTKIIATIGPASDTFEDIVRLIDAGVNIFRLNFSHGDYAYHEKAIDTINKAMKKTNSIVGILQDISGPKIRLGDLEENFELEKGDVIYFKKENIIGKKIAQHRYEMSLNHLSVIDKLKVGEYIYLYDGLIRTKVIATHADGAEVVVQNRGMLSSKKGINFPDTSLGINALTLKDKKDIAWGIEHGVDFMAISFIQTAKDMINARELIESHNGKQILIAKIEKYEAAKNIDAILEVSDGLMVARGDLGIEVPYYKVPSLQKMLIKKANLAAKPVITATQMLLSMVNSPRATRAEISDIANAVFDGTDAVMLSEESAIGKYPVQSVKTMSATIKEAEKKYEYYKLDSHQTLDDTNAVSKAAVMLCKEISVKGIISFTASGKSARELARYKPAKTIYAVTHHEWVHRQLTLTWGVLPILNTDSDSLDIMIKNTMKHNKKESILDPKSSYILTAGDPTGITGSTSMIKLLREGEMGLYT